MQTAVRLTPREAEVLGLIARGCTYAQAAQRMGISLHTVTTHIKSSYQKLDVHSAGSAVMRAVELGLLRIGYDRPFEPLAASMHPSAAPSQLRDRM